MNQSIAALLILGSLLGSSDSFVTNPNGRNPATTTLHTPSFSITTERTSTPVTRWASTMDKKDVDEQVSNNENDNDNDDNDNDGNSDKEIKDLNKDDDINNFNKDNDDDSSSNTSSSTNSGTSLGERITNSGVVSAAAMAAAAVNAAVSMKSLEAPDVSKSYIALDKTQQELDEEGLPLVYDKDVIEAYWSKERGALNKRWGYFVGKAVPFFTKLTTLFIRDGKIVDEEIPALSRQVRIDLQDLGPTFIKAGQMMSVRPDVLPTATLDELTKLQDSVEAFDTKVAVEQIEKELGGPLGQFFTSISEEPVAAASLAQVYLATLNDGNDTKVAVKVQRPDVLATVSKDLYVLRRAAEVFQGLVDRFAPQQRYGTHARTNERTNERTIYDTLMFWFV